MVSRWLAFVLWALAAATAVAWLLQLVASGRPVPAYAVSVDTMASPRGDLTRLLGAPPPVVEAPAAAVQVDSRYTLVGLVAAPGAASAGSALAVIAIDGKPARAYRVGAALDDQTVLLAVRPRGVDLGPRGGPLRSTLELAPLAPPATGALPGAGVAPGGPAYPQGVPGMPPQAAPQPPVGGAPDANLLPDGAPGRMLTPQPVPQPSPGQNPSGPPGD